MKILILTCNTGMGHNSTAGSIKEKFKEHNIECDSADALAFVSRPLSRLIGNMHSKIYRHAPVLFDKGYEFAEKHPSSFGDKSLSYKYFRLGVKKLHKFIEENGYTGIICVHSFSAMMTSCLMKKFPSSLKTVFVATDYTCSPGVATSPLDLYFIPHKDLTEEFISCGVPKKKIVPAGIPVKNIFYEKTEKKLAREALSLPEGSKHILMMCGSMGCGPMASLTKSLAKALPENVYLSVVCGTNKKLKRRIDKFQSEKVQIFGYTDKVPLLMDSADLYVTKAGGISVTEAAAKQLPMVFIDAISGCETHNRIFFANHSMAFLTDKHTDLPKFILERLSDEPALLKQKENMKANFNSSSAEIICNYFINQ